MTLIVMPTTELKDNMYLVAKLKGPDGQLLGKLEKPFTGGQRMKELSFAFKGIRDVNCGLYRAEVEVYKDNSKDRSVGLHQQGIISTVDIGNVRNVGDIVTKGVMGTCRQEP